MSNNIVSMKAMNKIDIYRISSNISTYEIFKSSVIGTGTYSTVYLGRCISLNKSKDITHPEKLVAIKKINIQKISYSDSKMVISETDIMQNIISNNHNNIVDCYDIINDNDVTYIIMEYCDGGDLSGLLIGKSFCDKYIRFYFGQIISAIKFLHDKKIVHRDMKPKNVLLSNNKKTIKLCDFGFAKQINPLKRITTVCGSPLYMAPELCKKESYTELVDVWSLGIMLYEMIFGNHPFSKYNDIESLSSSIIKNNIIIEDTDKVSEKCLDLLKKMLQKDECDRINIDQLFEHDWVKNECNLSDEELETMFLTENIHSYIYHNDKSQIEQNSDLNNSCEKLMDSSSELIFDCDSI